MTRIAPPVLLRDTVFRRYWAATTISVFGDQVSSIAMPLSALLVLHAGAAVMGVLTALQWLPSLLFGMHAGAWADRTGRRRHIMIAADLGRAALLGSVPVGYALHVLTLAQLCAVAFAAGTLSVLFSVADATLFVSVVAAEAYVDGKSLTYGSRALSFVGGPSVGGLLAQALTAPFAVAADALSFLGSACYLSRIRPAEPPPAGRDVSGATTGLRFIARSAIVRASLTASAVINLFSYVFLALFTLYAVRVLGMRPDVLGVVLGAGAVGGVLGAMATKRLAARIGLGNAFLAGSLGYTAPVALVPLAPAGGGALTLGMVFAAEFLSGFGVMVLDVSIGSIFAAVIPAPVRSRVTGAFQAINYGTRPAGALLGGLLGSTLGPRPTLWIAVAGAVLGALLLVPSPVPRFRLPPG